MERRELPVALAGVAVAVIWGLTFLSIKVAVVALSPMNLALARFVIASAILPLIALATRTNLRIELKDLPRLVACGLIGVTLYFYFENNGILRLSASESSIIVGTIPVITLLAEAIIYKFRPAPRLWSGILLSFAGVAAIVARSGDAKASAAGYLFMVGAALSWVIYTIITRPLSAKYPLLSITFWQILIGTLGCIPFAAAEGFDFSRVDLPVALNVAFLGVLGSAFGYWCYVVMLERLGACRSSVFINLIPVVSIAAAFFILGERLAPSQLAGGAAAIVGVWLVTSR